MSLYPSYELKMQAWANIRSRIKLRAMTGTQKGELHHIPSFLTNDAIQRMAGKIIEASKEGRDATESLNWITEQWPGPTHKVLRQWLNT